VGNIEQLMDAFVHKNITKQVLLGTANIAPHLTAGCCHLPNFVA